MSVSIDGACATRFEPIKRVFESLWDDVEVGASVCVYVGGEKVVDLWGGWQDQAQTRPWQEDTLVNVYSTTKGPASLVTAMLVDEGLLDFSAKVTDYWPEFGARGKGDVTVAQLLSHQGGVAGVDRKLTVEDLYDWGLMVDLLANQPPLWPLGEGAGYHAVTWGFLAGELTRRVSGKTLGQYLAKHVCQPLGADFYVGLPDSEMRRVADLIGPNRARRQPVAADGPPASSPPLNAIALANPVIAPYKHACSTAWRKAELAAANGQANARGVARIYAAIAGDGEIDGVRLLRPEGIDAAAQLEVDLDIDLVTGVPMRRARGFMLNTDGGYGPNDTSLGHGGAGGSLGFADRGAKVGFGYAMNQMQADPNVVPRSRQLVDALYACL
jgi:CubicO group peptidase (beta-lactamase class C family)